MKIIIEFERKYSTEYTDIRESCHWIVNFIQSGTSGYVNYHQIWKRCTFKYTRLQEKVKLLQQYIQGLISESLWYTATHI